MPTVDPPIIPSGKEIYDLLMEKIEPELVSASLPGLDEKYKDETEEEKKTRGLKYQKAFEDYDKACEKYIAQMKEKVATYRKNAFSGVESEDREKETEEMKNIESLIQNA